MARRNAPRTDCPLRRSSSALAFRGREAARTFRAASRPNPYGAVPVRLSVASMTQRLTRLGDGRLTTSISNVIQIHQHLAPAAERLSGIRRNTTASKPPFWEQSPTGLQLTIELPLSSLGTMLLPHMHCNDWQTGTEATSIHRLTHTLAHSAVHKITSA